MPGVTSSMTPRLTSPPHLLGVFQLLADGYALARPHQLGQVGVDGMVGEPRQFDVGCRTVGPPRERNAEYAAGLDRVLAECLVKVPYPEEQDGIGMHRLDRIILLHQRCLDIFFVYFFLCVHNKKIVCNFHTKITEFGSQTKPGMEIIFLFFCYAKILYFTEFHSFRILFGKIRPSTPQAADRPATRRAYATAACSARHIRTRCSGLRPVRRTP